MIRPRCIGPGPLWDSESFMLIFPVMFSSRGPQLCFSLYTTFTNPWEKYRQCALCKMPFVSPCWARATFLMCLSKSASGWAEHPGRGGGEGNHETQIEAKTLNGPQLTGRVWSLVMELEICWLVFQEYLMVTDHVELPGVIAALPVNGRCSFLSGIPDWMDEPRGSGCPSPSVAAVILIVDVLKWSEVNTDCTKSGYRSRAAVFCSVRKIWVSSPWSV